MLRWQIDLLLLQNKAPLAIEGVGCFWGTYFAAIKKYIHPPLLHSKLQLQCDYNTDDKLINCRFDSNATRFNAAQENVETFYEE